MIWLGIGSATMVLTAFIHCWIGEKRLITPLLAIDHRLTTTLLPRRLIRFAWHLTGGLMIVCAAVVVWPGVPVNLVMVTGLVWLSAGLIDAVVTRGQHLGWPLLVVAGLATLVGTTV